MIKNFCKFIGLIGILVLLLASCNQIGGVPYYAGQSPTIIPSLTKTSTHVVPPSETSTPQPILTQTRTNTPTNTPTPTITDTPTQTQTPTLISTPTISPTPTFDFPNLTINVANAHCRYGPGKAYLHAADLSKYDRGLVWNRNYAGTWLWARFDKLNYACWVAASVADIDGDIFSVSTYSPPLPKSTLYGPPERVITTRKGDQVLVSWEEVWMTDDDDRGYLLQLSVCQNGNLIDLTLHTDGTSYTVLDEKNCAGDSKGRLYAVEKHGYTEPVEIPWP